MKKLGNRLSRRKQLIVTLSILSLFTLIVILLYVYHSDSSNKNVVTVQQQDDQTQTGPAGNKENGRATTSIKTVDNLKDIQSDPSTPQGWKRQPVDGYGLNFAYPSEQILEAKSKAELTRALSGDIGIELSVVLRSSDNKLAACCFFSVKDINFTNSVRDFEAHDRADDGKVSSNPLILIQDIKEKDNFTFNGKSAVRFVQSVRSSRSAEANLQEFYFIEAGNQTYELHSKTTPDGTLYKFLNHIAMP